MNNITINLLSILKDKGINTEYGIYNPSGIYNNPLTGEPYKNIYSNIYSTLGGEYLSNTYQNLSKNWANKIVYNNKDKIINTIIENQVILLTAGTGVGKTILVPRIALHSFDYKEKIICTIPKRLPTFNTASFVAKCMDVVLGEEVGYYYQGTHQIDKNNKNTKLIFTTTGSLISRMTGDDPLLLDYKCIIVDEAHERSVQTDQLLLLLKKACITRKDLKIIIMSATIDLERLRNYYPNKDFKFGEVDAGSELSYPVKDAWLDKKPLDWKPVAINITLNILEKTISGDIMIFVKSGGDATQFCQLLQREMQNFRNKLKKRQNLSSLKSSSKSLHELSLKSSSKLKIPVEYKINPLCIKLESSSKIDEQILATDENKYKTLLDDNGYPYTRKIVVTTNVAESSLTFEGIVFIIDSGYEYTEGYEPSTRVRSLLENMISQSAVKQRKGRAGRTQPGYCFHLYSENEMKHFEKYPKPSIEKTDITNDILDLMRMPNCSNIKELRLLLDEFITPPHKTFISNSLKTLYTLGAITSMKNDGIITPLGFALTKFRAIKVNYAKAIIMGYFLNCARDICDIVALITLADGKIENFFLKFFPDKRKSKEWNKTEEKRYIKVMKNFTHSTGDYLTLYKMYGIYLNNIKKNADKSGKKKQSSKKLEKQEQLNDIEDNLNVINDELDNQEENDNEQIKSVRKWCKFNFINFNNLRRVKLVSKQLYLTVIKLFKTLHAKTQKHNSSTKKTIKKSIKKVNSNGKENVRELSNFANVDTVMTEVDGLMPKMSIKHAMETEKKMGNLNNGMIQIGGYAQNIKHHENLRQIGKNIRRFDNKEDNILYALALGNVINLAIGSKHLENKLYANMNDIYIPCFAETKKMCKINKDSFITGNNKIIMYDEIFMSVKDQKILKINMVNKLPEHIIAKLKQQYPTFTSFC